MIYHLIYVSTARFPLPRPRLEDLLETSRKNNLRNSLTGMLAYAGGNFMQFLEGPKEAVEELMSRIERDSRHFDVTRLFTTETPERWCAEWQMAYAAGVTRDDIDVLVNLTRGDGNVLPGTEEANIARLLLRRFVAGNR
ncbi:MAG: hypothetical protein RL477_80 [Pseudomonadota bacterium]|jgi:hypothetical protein